MSLTPTLDAIYREKELYSQIEELRSEIERLRDIIEVSMKTFDAIDQAMGSYSEKMSTLCLQRLQILKGLEMKKGYVVGGWSMERDKESYSMIEELRSEIEQLKDIINQQEIHILNMGWPEPEYK